MKKISLIILMVGLSLLVLAGCEGGGIIPSPHGGNTESGTIIQDSGTENSEDTGDKENLEIIKADSIKPVITGTHSPLPNAFGWNNTDVVVSFTCEEVGPIQSGIVINTVEGMTVTTEGEGQSVTNTGTCVDAAGNIADPVIVSGINIDKTPPVVIINLSKNGRYKVNESIEVSWTAEDKLSGLDESKALRKIKIDTKSKGKKKLIIPRGFIKDRAGNESEEIVIDYEVVGNENIVEPPTNPVPTPPQEPEPKPEDPAPALPNPDYIYPQQWATGDGTKNNPWANDCIKKAYNACSSGGTIYLKAGYYRLDSALELTKTVSLIGEGTANTIILTANTMTGLNVVKDHCILQGFTVDADAMTAVSASAINVGYCDYVVIGDVEVKNSSYYGINIINVNHSQFRNISANNNKRHGIHPGCSIAGRHQYNTFDNLYLYNNGVNGFDDYSTVDGQHNTYNNLNCHNNGEHGIAIFSQIGSVLSNSSADNNGLNGIFLRDTEGFSIKNSSANFNANAGIFLSLSKNVNFISTVAKNNGTGVKSYDSNGLTFTSCQFYDDRKTPLQQYGLELYQTNTNISLLYCQLTPNQRGEIYNPDEVKIKKHFTTL